MVQAEGATQGVHFDPATLRPLAGNAATTAAARAFARLRARAMPLPASATACTHVHPGFAQGRCVLVVGSLEQIKVRPDRERLSA